MGLRRPYLGLVAGEQLLELGATIPSVSAFLTRSANDRAPIFFMTCRDLAVGTFGLATALNYAYAGPVDWPLAAGCA
jgi:hypothetical protein